MKRLLDCTKILRSKNAGPLFITFDLIFRDREALSYVAQRLTKAQIAAAYDIPEEKIDIIVYDVVNSIKITFPRKRISGCLQDTDVYGCQQHVPLANLTL